MVVCNSQSVDAESDLIATDKIWSFAVTETYSVFTVLIIDGNMSIITPTKVFCFSKDLTMLMAKQHVTLPHPRLITVRCVADMTVSLCTRIVPNWRDRGYFFDEGECRMRGAFSVSIKTETVVLYAKSDLFILAC